MRYPRASTIGSQLLGNPAMSPHAAGTKTQAPVTLRTSAEREIEEKNTYKLGSYDFEKNNDR